MRVMDIVGRLAFAAFLIALVVGLVAALGTRFHVFGYQTGVFGIFPFCLYAGAAGLLFGAAWGLVALFSDEGSASGYGATGFLGSLAIMALPLYTFYMVDIAHAIPPIHDISTDTEFPPQFSALLHERAGAATPATYDGPIMVKTYDGKIRSTAQLQKLFYSDIKTIGVLSKAPVVFRRALTAAGNMGWHIVAAVPTATGGRIEATDETLLFGLTDDIVIRVKASGIGSLLDVRSKSRFGASDFGANHAHIRAYLTKFANTG